MPGDTVQVAAPTPPIRHDGAVRSGVWPPWRFPGRSPGLPTEEPRTAERDYYCLLARSATVLPWVRADGRRRRARACRYGRGWRVPVSHHEQPEPDGQDELHAAFEAPGGPLTWDELDLALLGSDQYRPALVRQARLLGR